MDEHDYNQILISYLVWLRLALFQNLKAYCIGIAELRICSCLACVYRVIDARGKFGEHKKYVRVTRGAAESNPSLLSALQTSQVHP